MLSNFLTLKCPSCGKKIAEADNLCQHCGLDLNAPLKDYELQELAKPLLAKARRALEAGRNLKDALLDCDQAIEYLPESAEAHNLRGLILDGLGKTQEAIKAFQEAVRLQPDYEEAKENLAEAENEPLALAKQHLEYALRALERSSDLYYALHDCDLAIEYFPGLAEAHNLRGLILDSLGKTEGAIEEYREAIRLKPDYTEAQENLAEVEVELLRSKPPHAGESGFAATDESHR